MKSKGFILLEVLAAVTLSSLIALGIASVLFAAFHAKAALETTARIRMPIKKMEARISKDLRAAVKIRNYSFQGKKDAITFPALLPAFTAAGESKKALFNIHYLLKQNCLIRQTSLISAGFHADKKEETILCDLRAFAFYFPYQEDKESDSFQPFWMDDPYLGIPKAVRLEADLVHEGTSIVHLSRLIYIPQGVAGVFSSQEKPLGEGAA